MFKITIKYWQKYRTLNYTRIKPRSRPPHKKSAYFIHPDVSAAKIEKKVRKLHKQIQYIAEWVEMISIGLFLIMVATFTETDSGTPQKP
jgi:hypothetical protein